MEFEKRTESEHEKWIAGNNYKYELNTFYDFWGINKNDFFEITFEIISLLKTKGLTMRQAQIVLMRCKELILDAVNVD